MIVTMDIFSGRPNPTWDLSEKEADQLLERVAGKSLRAAHEGEMGLGFRGFVVHVASDGPLPAGLPPSFRVDSVPGDTRGLSASDTDDAVKFLLGTGGKALDEQGIGNIVEEAVKMAREHHSKEAPEPSAPPADDESLSREAKPGCVINNPAYNPAFWNNATVQPHNNCYNYSMNYRSDTFAQPGRISGHPNNVMQCANVATAANWDGCKTTCSGSNKLVALVIWPGADYHWYRRQAAGFWAHKPGSTAVRNVDNAGQIINGTTRTPQNCNRGPYTIFCGYRYSPNKVAGHSNRPGSFGMPVR